MFKRLLTRFSLIAALLGLSACATVPQGSSSLIDQTAFASITNKVSLGSMIEVPPEGGVDSSQARVVDEYFSASGRHCVRVELTQPGSSTRVICERDGGNWSFTRSLTNDKVPTAGSDELLITTPLSGVETAPIFAPVPAAAPVQAVDRSRVADTLGTVFEAHYNPLPAFDGASLWNVAGTSTAGPANWTQLAMVTAIAPALQDFVVTAAVEKPITGRR